MYIELASLALNTSGIKPAMKGFSIIFLFLFCFFVSFQSETEAAATQNNVYIVYMGAAASTYGTLRDDHYQLLTSLLQRNEDVLVHNYRHGFSGFAARLSAEEARLIAQQPGVVSVFPDTKYQLHTTHSWEFLKHQTDLEIDSGAASESDSQSRGADTIIGILDTGIWPESESFSDNDMGPIPSRWKGTCMEAKDFKKSNCNRKLIGARFYKDPDEDPPSNPTPRDTIGHGTHVASTAAGSVVKGASYYSLATGTAKGGSPSSRIATYKVCNPGCTSSTVLAAFDDAIADGVDVLSLSFGAPSFALTYYYEDPIAIGAFHAVDKGITVVCSAGNDGPESLTVVNAAPWILTVGASTIDRDFHSDVVLGGNKVIKGESINFNGIEKSPVYPLIYGKSAKNDWADEDEARTCRPARLNETMIKGKIVVCENDKVDFSNKYKMEGVKDAGGIGLILIDDIKRSVASNYGTSPLTVVSSKDGAEILSYINSTKNPVATILPTVSETKFKPAPVVGYFSARGPNSDTRNILKPDIAAPGVDILAAWIGNDTKVALEGRDPPSFNVISGTSMACPHVSGIVAVVKSRNPTWGPSVIKSAIMTTATQTNNLGGPITTETGLAATGYDFGAGEVSSKGPLDPGLVYETTTFDYLNFMCYFGYNLTTIKLVAKDIPEGFNCSPKESSVDAISDINYPSIAISSFNGKKDRKVSRTVTNVGVSAETIYTVTIDAPKELNVKVVPEKLQFTKNAHKLSYQVSFTSTASSLKEDVFGSITWSDGKYKVRTPFVVSSKASSSQ